MQLTWLAFSYRKQTRVDNKVAILDSKFLTGSVKMPVPSTLFKHSSDYFIYTAPHQWGAPKLQTFDMRSQTVPTY